LAGQAGEPTLAVAKRKRKPATGPRAGRKPPEAGPEVSHSVAAPAASSLESALAAAEAATAALRQAGREAPARYDVALHYRLDSLAHHLQQVKEFVASLAAR
jgi:hypothetical protein